jgi:hypothetical protein
MTPPSFQKFERSSARIAAEPMISIQRHGTMSFNRATYEALGKPEAVVLLWDAEAEIVALQMAESSDPDAYTVQKQPAASSFLVNTQSFYKFNNIKANVARRFPAHNYGDGIVGLVLSEGREISGRTKRRRPAPSYPSMTFSDPLVRREETSSGE